MPRSLLQWSKLLRDVLHRRRIRILAYHNVAENFDDPFCVSPQAFAEQMQLLAESHIPVISLEQARQTLLQPASLRPALVITLDDAYADLLKYAIPAMLQHHFPATIYAVTGKVGQSSDWGQSSPSYPTLAWSDLTYLSSLGFAIGSHTQTHSHLPALGHAALQRELSVSKEDIQIHTGQTFISLAYPYGEFGERERSVAQQVGYSCAVAASGLWGNGNGSDAFALRRELMGRHADATVVRRTIFGQNDFILVFTNPHVLHARIGVLTHFVASLLGKDILHYVLRLLIRR